MKYLFFPIAAMVSVSAAAHTAGNPHAGRGRR